MLNEEHPIVKDILLQEQSKFHKRLIFTNLNRIASYSEKEFDKWKEKTVLFIYNKIKCENEYEYKGKIYNEYKIIIKFITIEPLKSSEKMTVSHLYGEKIYINKNNEVLVNLIDSKFTKPNDIKQINNLFLDGNYRGYHILNTKAEVLKTYHPRYCQSDSCSLKETSLTLALFDLLDETKIQETGNIVFIPSQISQDFLYKIKCNYRYLLCDGFSPSEYNPHNCSSTDKITLSKFVKKQLCESWELDNKAKELSEFYCGTKDEEDNYKLTSRYLSLKELFPAADEETLKRLTLKK